jgi:hypothetical protein
MCVNTHLLVIRKNGARRRHIPGRRSPHNQIDHDREHARSRPPRITLIAPVGATGGQRVFGIAMLFQSARQHPGNIETALRGRGRGRHPRFEETRVSLTGGRSSARRSHLRMEPHRVSDAHDGVSGADAPSAPSAPLTPPAVLPAVLDLRSLVALSFSGDLGESLPAVRDLRLYEHVRCVLVDRSSRRHRQADVEPSWFVLSCTWNGFGRR